MNKPALIREPFEKAGEKLYKLDAQKARQDAARFFLDALKQMQTETAE